MGGGGGTSGKVDYPEYMKDVHEDWLWTHATMTLIEQNVTQTMNAALGASPFSALTVFDPDDALDAMDGQIATLLALNPATKQEDYLGQVSDGTVSTMETMKNAFDDLLYDSTFVDADINAFSALLGDELDSEILPRFRRGMQDINAVQTSAYVIGLALLEERKLKEVTKYGTALRLQNYAERAKGVLTTVTTTMDLAYRTAVAELEFKRAVTTLYADSMRIRIIAKKEELVETMNLVEKDGAWDLEVYQYGANVLAAIGGGAMPTQKKPNQALSTLGGAISGGMTGAQIGGQAGGGYGAAIGGVIGSVLGGLGGYFSSE